MKQLFSPDDGKRTNSRNVDFSKTLSMGKIRKNKFEYYVIPMSIQFQVLITCPEIKLLLANQSVQFIIIIIIIFFGLDRSGLGL
jgi:hypothetical protein